MNETTPLVLEGEAPLVAMLTVPSQGVTRSQGVLICAPLGHENICSYRPLRTLAEHLADCGWPVLRFDFPGCGDSADRPAHPADLTIWTDPVHQALAALRHHAGVDRVALVGLRVGATLGMLAASTATGVSDVVLLSPFATGHAYLRQLRVFEALARQPPEEVASAWQQPDGIAASGFLVTPSEAAVFEAIDLATLDNTRPEIQRALVVMAQPERGATSLVQRLEETVPDVVYEVSPGLAAAWDDTSIASFPAASAERVSGWLAAGGAPQDGPDSAVTRPNRAVLTTNGIREETVTFEGSHGALVAVTCEPVARASGRDWVIFLSAGGVRRSGPNRLWTTLARSWADAGLPSLRLDVSGVGDSDEAPDAVGVEISRFYTTDVGSDIVGALAWLEARGAERVASIGLCSGAYWSFHTALAGARLSTISMINPAVLFWDEHDSSLRAVSEAWSILKSPRAWPRLLGKGARSHMGSVVRGLRHKLSGQIDADASRGRILEAFEQLRERGVAAHAVYSQGDLSVMHVERHLGSQYVSLIEATGATVDVIAGPDHTFRPLWSHDLLRASLEANLRRAGMLPTPVPPDPVAATSRAHE